MKSLRIVAAAIAVTASLSAGAFAEQRAAQPAGPTLRVTVLDETDAALITAQVTVVDAKGVERTAPVSPQGVATFDGVATGAYQVRAGAEGFRTVQTSVTVRRGNAQVTLRLPLATIEQTIVVQEENPADRRDNGFSQTLTPDEIEALSDDPDEMAQQLADIAGPGAQIFVDGFRGGALPPKDQIQQIRFHTNSFAAEYHEAGMVRVEVVTRPGMGGWRGRANFGFGDESLNAKNAFAPAKEPQQNRRYNISYQGPLVPGRTGLALSVDGNDNYDSRTIVARSPAGGVSGLATSTNVGLNANVRLEHLISQGNQLRAEYSRRSNTRGNLGVGDFDLPSRAFDQENTTDTFRVRNTRMFGKRVFSELRFEVTSSSSDTTSLSADPIVRVNDAFTAGGAGQLGGRRSREIELAQNVDFTGSRTHAVRAGFQLESGWWESTQRSNVNGTYTFTSLDAYLAGRPATYSIRVGDPLVDYRQTKFGWYVQDDVRLKRTLSVSFGVRHELQTQMDDRWNLAPRAAFTWNATRNTVVRGGYGIFYDWFESNLYEQTIRVDGTHQIDLIVQNPAFPVSDASRGTSLPPSVIRAGQLVQPVIQQASIGVERPITSWMGLRADYFMTRESHSFRSINVNAPVDGVRPDSTAGNITEIGATGRQEADRVTIATNLRATRQRIFGNVMYQFGRVRNYADGATSLPSDSTNPDADWGPSARDVRHRLFLMVNTPIGFGLRAGLNMQIASATPYNITTGRDDNNDTVFNDRPAGVGRNSARGNGLFAASLRLNRSIGFGGPAGGPGGPGMPPMPPPGGGAALQRGPGGGPGGGDGPQIMIVEGGNQRYRIDFFAQISNLFNTVNYTGFVGNLLSPFYGRPTSAGPARRVEVGVSLGF
jgi:hypothetical protein